MMSAPAPSTVARWMPHGRAALAVLVAIVAASGAWSAVLGGAVLWIVPIAAIAAALAAAPPAPRATGALLVCWPPIAVLAAGVPAGRLWPGDWISLLTELSDGAMRLVTLGPGRVIGDPPATASWLLVTGSIWMVAGALAARFSSSSSSTSLTAAFGLLAAPWVVAVVLRQTDDVAWQGAAMLFAILLWFAPRRVSAWPVVALGAAAALVSMLAAYAFGPRDPWLAMDEIFQREARFTSLDTTQTYGPLNGRRSGTTMLEITAPEPALWRMQVLDRFGWRGWELGLRPRPVLPEPAGRTVDIQVQVAGLRNDMIVSPGEVLAVDTGGRVSEGSGEARRLAPAPRRGDTYGVRASIVRATADELRAAPPPTDPRLSPYTRLWSSYGTGGLQGRFGAPPDTSTAQMALLGRSPFQGVLDLSQRLAAGARNEFEMVERVQRYLLEGNRFRYTTDVASSRSMPLVDFLLRDHAGYCQHFAGAAALLLRLAGVPTRVVVGFATGVRASEGHYNVRDADAHAWIEVYFQDYGWVPFNPTPAAADAKIAPGVDPLASPTAASGYGGGASAVVPVAIPIALVLGVVTVVRRRGRRTQLDAYLERLVRRTGGQVTPSTTLTELRTQLARFGPRSAALATEVERIRFGPDPGSEPGPDTAHPRIRIARALVADLGARRALLVLIAPTRSGSAKIVHG